MHHRQHCTALHQVGQRILDFRFAMAVEHGSRLVENQNRRVLEERPGDTQTLALAAGQHHPAFAHQGVVTFRWLADEGVAEGMARGGDHLFVAGVRSGVADVLADAAVEQHGLLLHHGHARTGCPD